MATINMGEVEVRFRFPLPTLAGTPIAVRAIVEWRDTSTDGEGAVDVVKAYTGAQLAGVSLKDVADAVAALAKTELEDAGTGGHTVNEGS